MELVKATNIKRIVAAGIIAVIRGFSEENSFQIASACIKGEVNAIEIAFTSPNAEITIKRLKERYSQKSSIIIGAGTVLDPFTARLAIVNGAEFIVSPSFNVETAKICNLYQIPYIPGCYTLTEIQTALTYGADVIKLFPGTIAGSNAISEIHGPFPNVNIVPTGGISYKNMIEWFKNGAIAVGIGGSMTSPGKKGDYQSVMQNAHEFHKKFVDFSGINKN